MSSMSPYPYVTVHEFKIQMLAMEYMKKVLLVLSKECFTNLDKLNDAQFKSAQK